MDMIKVADMLTEMRKTVGLNRPKPFSLIYATADRKRNTGGQFRELRKAVLLPAKYNADRVLKLQPLGTRDVVAVHLDLILYFNAHPVA